MSVTPENVTTMQSLKPAVASTTIQNVAIGFGSSHSFELMQRAGKALSASTLVPKEYIGNLPNCIIALEMASRIGASPLMVMQNLYVVHGRPSWSAKFLIACFNQCGRFAAIRYRFSGTEGKDDWTCVAYSTEFSTKEKITGPAISIALAKKEGWYQKSGSKWQTIPQLMLMYRSAAWLVNTHAPELSMGINTDEETHDVFSAQRTTDGRFEVTTESLRQVIDMQSSTDQRVDTNTGEILTEDKSDYIPQYDKDSALAAIKATKTQDALAKLSVEITADFKASNRPLPIDVEAAWNDRSDTLEQNL